MHSAAKGFTLIELMVVVVIIGILAAIAIPNFIAMQARAKEGATKANMHTFQLSAEDYGIQYDGIYADTGDQVEPMLPGAGATFRNPFDQSTGKDNSWEDRGSVSAAPATTSGIVSYADSGRAAYNIKAYGKSSVLNLVLTAGQ